MFFKLGAQYGSYVSAVTKPSDHPERFQTPQEVPVILQCFSSLLKSKKESKVTNFEYQMQCDQSQ